MDLCEFKACIVLSILPVQTQYIGRILELLLRRFRRFVEDKVTVFVGLCRTDCMLWVNMAGANYSAE